MHRLLISLTFLICIPLLGVAWGCFSGILFRRNVLRVAWGGEIDEDVWGIGQIIATLAWAPLLVEMGYSAFKLVLKRRRQGEPAASSGANSTTHDLEEG
jgi:hypothetical protein